MRKLLFNLHLYLAILAGIFILILGATGTIMAFEPELDHILHWRLSFVMPQGHAMPITQIASAINKAYPGERIGGYLIPTAPDLAYQASIKRGAVSVNQYTGDVLGLRESAPDFLSNVHQLHLRLLIRNKSDTGKTIMSWAGVASLALFASGLYLWFPAMRLSIGGKPGSFRYWFDLHSASGVIALLFLLVLGFTGVMIGFEEHTVPRFYKFTGSAPSKNPEIPPPPPGAKPISLDEAMEVARNAIPGATPFQINVPGPKGAYNIRSHFPEDLTPGGRSRVVVGQYTGQVLFAEGSRTAPAGSRLVILNRAIHTGDIFRLLSQTVMSLGRLTMVVQVISGA